jgi:PRC-barrel domain protein
MTELPERDDFGDYGQWPGRAVLDPSGRRLGEIREIYLDDATDRPEWVLVDLGDDGPRFVPLADATVAEDAIKVAQDPDRIGTAPTLEPSQELTQDEERRLYSHYGLRYSEDESDSLLPDPDQPPATEDAATTERAGADATTADDGATTEGAGPEGAAAAAAAGGTAAAALPPTPPSDGEDRPRPEAGTPADEGDAAPQPAASAPAAGRPKLRRYVGAGRELPPAGDTSEPKDTGPMVPPRPEPVAPPRAEPEPEPEAGGPLALVRRNPVPVGAGVAAAIAAIVFILLRRR